MLSAPGPSSKRRPQRRVPRPASVNGGRWLAVWNGRQEVAAIVAGGLEASGFRTRAMRTGSLSAGHMGIAEALSTVYVPERQAEEARALLEEQGEGGGIVRADSEAVADNARMVVRLMLWSGAVLAVVALIAALRAALG
jgi:hypothetical protein